MSRARRELVLSVAFAFWGLAIAIAMLSVWNQPAPPHQLPGSGKALGFDAHGPFRWVASLILLPALVPLLLRPVSRLLAGAQTWAFRAAAIAPFIALWLVTSRRDVIGVILPCALVLGVCAVLRNRDLGFTRRDAVLIPVFLTTYLAIFDVGKWLHTDVALWCAAFLVFAVRIAVSFIPSPAPAAYAFMAAPLGLVLQTGFFARDERYFGWHALAIVAVTPFILRLVVRDVRRAAAVMTLVVYPLSLYCYWNAISLPTAEGRPRIDFFEDSHSLLPASEYLRGERPYRDILPAHGLIEDGGFDYLAMKLGGVDAGSRTKARVVAGTMTSIALYAVAFAVTGSAEAALLAVFLCFLTGAFSGSLRLLPSLVTLAFIAAAVRRRRPRLLLFAGFGAVLCGATSLDFGAYTFVTLVVAIARAGNQRMAAIRSAAIGIAAAAIPLFGTFALFGILDDFVRGTFVETLGVGPAYTLWFFTPPQAFATLRSFPDVLAALFDHQAFDYLFWCAMAVFVGVTVTRRVSRRLEPLVLVGVWMLLTAVSYAERHHLYFGIAAPVVIVYAIRRLLQTRNTLAVPAIVAVLAFIAPTTHVGVIGWMRNGRGPLEKTWLEVREPARARGALYYEKDAAATLSVGKYLSLSLRPDETFFDFTNSGILYFLYRRDCPIREYEVAFYETEEKQREVIRRIESNPRVRAALVPASPLGRFTVDGVPNQDRAPLVWQYLQDNFTPDFQEGEVVFWRRK